MIGRRLVLTGLASTVAVAACGGPGPAGSPSGAPTGATGSASGAAVRVAAASDLAPALAEIANTLPAQGISVDVASGSSGTFYQQLANGAPFDLFLSADMTYPTRLVEAGLADRADLVQYAVGQLVLWVPTGSRIDPDKGLAALTDAGVHTIALANPDHAPYGKAAMAALTSADILDQVRDKLVYGENVSQAAQFAQSGNADVGLVALSLALTPPMRSGGRHVLVPAASYPPLRQGALVMRAAAARGTIDAARRVRDHLVSPQGRAVLSRYGFAPPGN